ncbi:hypothetical protein HW450_05245 [Corynebacterium hindlerae]|uniref:Uncharacterized protein n=1 Tax=Corynebacterium hindlerae TaxID=699041 RepID=A0A7G5FHN1_9CORY|nr:hypothetical protein [Corynebacterium hindlerae]QMV86122.1 hypothetical protein HW450_05245 [Corynebacterium hindlerae]
MNKRSVTVRGLALWVAVFVALGVAGMVLIRPADNGYENLSLSFLTLGVLCELLSWCAIPLAAWLLVFLQRHGFGYGELMVASLAVAAISEVPYDIVNHGTWMSMASQNPVWAIFVSLIVLSAVERSRGIGTGARAAMIVFVCVAAAFWIVALALGTRFGVVPLGLACLAFLLVFHTLWDRENRMVYAAGVLGASMLIVPALSAIILHFRQPHPAPPATPACVKYALLYPFLQVVGAALVGIA